MSDFDDQDFNDGWRSFTEMVIDRLRRAAFAVFAERSCPDYSESGMFCSCGGMPHDLLCKVRKTCAEQNMPPCAVCRLRVIVFEEHRDGT